MKTLSLLLVGLRDRIGLRSVGLCAAVSMAVSLSAQAQLPLDNYDAVINADASVGLTPVASLISPVSLTGGAGVDFDFGLVEGDGSIEFILEGDPSTKNSSYLAVGQNSSSSLRYEVWDNTGEFGFTQGGVADYQFTPAVPSATKPTHIVYVLNPTTRTVTLYVNGREAGSTSDIAPAFGLPTGAGKLGSNPSGGEGMVGTIHRVTVYDTALDLPTIRKHSDALSADVIPALVSYDDALAQDAGNGLTPLTQQSSIVLIPSTGLTPFDFGQSSDDVTMEFILKGDISANESAFLAVGENTRSSLRYELWNNTGQLGFTQGGVADYQFSPGVTSPSTATHVAYVWNSAERVMTVFINGQVAGTTLNVDAGFAMPYGAGYLGTNPGGSERMSGVIYRVTVYDDLIPAEAIARHAKAFTDVLQPPSIQSFTVDKDHIAAGETARLSWQAETFKTLTINGVEYSGTSLNVTPAVTTTYVLVAQNDVGRTDARVTVYVLPTLDAYDAAITADAANIPTARLTEAVELKGDGGVPFDFGPVSDDVTIEFIVEGDPYANVNGYLAVGENSRSNLRYEQWSETTATGFTQLGVLDYLFTPAVPSPFWPTHLTYVYDSANTTMNIWVNGVLAGSVSGVSPDFGMPTGPGFLGANPDGDEAMSGTIFRVTVYDEILPDSAIRSHAEAFLNANKPALRAYDSLVTDGPLTPGVRLVSPIILNGSSGVPFDFGATTEDATFEFVLQGDPTFNNSAFLAVGANNLSSLRYEVWNNTGELGFTQARVADYQFVPGIPSPTALTHLAYVWQPSTTTMTLYVNGVLIGTTTGVSPDFQMPAGAGFLGSAGGAAEPMSGTIYRVTVYDDVVPAEILLDHAQAVLGDGRPVLKVGLQINQGTPAITLSGGNTGQHYRIEYADSLSQGGNWQSLLDIPSLPGNSITVSDTAPATKAQRYFRAVLVP